MSLKITLIGLCGLALVKGEGKATSHVSFAKEKEGEYSYEIVHDPVGSLNSYDVSYDDDASSFSFEGDFPYPKRQGIKRPNIPSIRESSKRPSFTHQTKSGNLPRHKLKPSVFSRQKNTGGKGPWKPLAVTPVKFAPFDFSDIHDDGFYLGKGFAPGMLMGGFRPSFGPPGIHLGHFFYHPRPTYVTPTAFHGVYSPDLAFHGIAMPLVPHLDIPEHGFHDFPHFDEEDFPPLPLFKTSQDDGRFFKSKSKPLSYFRSAKSSYSAPKVRHPIESFFPSFRSVKSADLATSYANSNLLSLSHPKNHVK